MDINFKKNKDIYFLLALFSISLFLRLYKQPNFPSCLHRDEVHFAYNAYSILKTGKDEWGEFLPIHFKFNGENHVPVIFYLISLSFALFGINDISVRMPSIIIGSIIPIIGFLLIKEIFNNRKVAFIFALLLAINPWQIINARASGQISIISQFFGVTGILFLFKSINQKKIKYYLFAGFCFILSYFSYIGSRFDIPLIIAVYLVLFYKQIPQKRKSLLLLIFLIIFPFYLVSIYPQRFESTSIITKHLSPLKEGQINFYHLSASNLKLLANTFRNLGFEFFNNYFDYLSPKYIFLNMGEPDRTNIENIGPIYLIETISVIFGIFYLIRQKLNKRILFIFILILITPIVGALTYNYPNRPNSARTVYFYFFITLISSYGINYLLKIKIINLLGLIFFSSISVAFLFIQLSLSNRYLGRARSCGYQQVFEELHKLEDQYDNIIIGYEYDYPYVFHLWYQKYDPKKYHQFLEKEKPEIVFFDTHPKLDWRLGNYTYVHDYCPITFNENTLIVGNFNHCKEKKNTRVYLNKNEEILVFSSPNFEKLFSRESNQIVFSHVSDIYEPSGKIAYSFYTYKPNNDNYIHLVEQEEFILHDNY